jgi:hypothetical protein
MGSQVGPSGPVGVMIVEGYSEKAFQCPAGNESAASSDVSWVPFRSRLIGHFTYTELVLSACRGLDNYLSVKQITKYTSSDPWSWYPAPSKL